MKDWLAAHRCHDYPHLIERCTPAAQENGLVIRPFAETGGYRLYALRTKPTPERRELPWIYISAGVHGDEPAGCEALLGWLRDHPEHLRRANYLLFPCLNPWGLVHNTRRNEEHLDLNRAFHLQGHRVIRPWREMVDGHRFELALHLHEDFDAQGIYLYEVGRDEADDGKNLGRRVLESAEEIIPIDPRPEIDGRQSQCGVIRPRHLAHRFTQSMPEALYLHQQGARYTLTVESPSEYALPDRVRALTRLTTCAVDLVTQPF